MQKRAFGLDLITAEVEFGLGQIRDKVVCPVKMQKRARDEKELN